MRSRTVLIVLGVLVAAGIPLYRFVFTDDVMPYPDREEHFKYGSVGSEPGGNLLDPVGGLLPPYRVFKVLPEICPELLKGGYRSLGLIYDTADGPETDLPIGISWRRRFGIRMLGVNCALCHVGTVRLTPDSRPRIYPGMPPQQVDVQRLFRFVFDCIQDRRFTTDEVIKKNVSSRPSATAARAAGGLPPMGWIEQQVFRWMLIPKLRHKVRSLAQDLGILIGDAVLVSGPGRLDTVNPGKALEVRWHLAELPMAELKAAADFPHIWGLSRRKDTRLHWDGNLGTVEETLLSAALAVGAKPQTLDARGFDEVTAYLMCPKEKRSEAERARAKCLEKPAYPYLDKIQAELRDAGEKVFEKNCAKCHTDKARQDNPVTPLELVATDRSRFDAFTPRFAELLPRALNRHYAGSRFEFRTFRKNNGYVPVPLDGIWARAPYLHNGSVPTLRDLLAPEECRPPRFYRGSDVFDRENVGFRSWAEPVATRDCAGQVQHREWGQGPPKGPDGTPTGPDGNRLFLFDTRVDGNHNTGHSGPFFGTELSKPEKDTLLEYLKSL